MADRLQLEETSGQNKWADIDDDDEDWAPEEITWTDGTKTTLPHTDEAAPPTAPEPVSSKTQTPPPPPPPSTAPAPPTAAPQQRQGLPSGRGMILNKGSAPEKPSNAAKPTVQQSAAKSPWATLPPVEKTSPVVSEPAQPTSRGPINQQWSQKGPAPPGPHMREISADDFSRSSWRGEGQGNRELFNSQSGRYEPVPERRGSLRLDQPKHPAVLQRPAGSEHPEPSSAFQTHRSSQEGQFGRRRGSSNVSGGSGSFYQRPGKGSDGHMPPPELSGGVRRPSFAVSSEGPASPALSNAGLNRGYQQAQQGHPPRPSPGANFATPHHAGQQPGATPHAPAPQSQNDVEYQAKLMKESREAARKRRLEEEARLEAEKKERIRKKLEAMGPPPEKKPKEASPVEQPLKPTQIQQRERVEPSDKPHPSTGPQHAGEGTENKVPQGGRVPPNKRPGAQPESSMPPATAPRRLSHGQEQRQPSTWTGSGPSPGTSTTSRTPGFTSWAGSQPPRNVWGAPNNNHGLGNGTFNPSLGPMLQDSPVAPPQSGKGPSLIAPPSMSREPSQGRQPQPPAPIGSRPNNYQRDPSLTSKWVSSVADNDKRIQAERIADKVERERQLAERGMKPEDGQPVIKETWRQVQVNDDGHRHTVPSRNSRVGNTWQAPGNGLQQPRETNRPHSHPGVIGSAPNQTMSGPTSQGLKTSRFFPARDARLETVSRPGSPTPPPPTMEGHPVYEGDITHPNVSLPKPHPVVKLPPSASAAAAQPKAPVPRQTSMAGTKPPSYKDAAAATPPTAPRGRAGAGGNEAAWQQKFNKLLSNDAAHRSAAIDASSKRALDYSYPIDSATVSLPGGHHAGGLARSALVESKPMAEECFDEPEMGSLPLVKVPRVAPDALWQPAEPSSLKPLHKRWQVTPRVIESIYFHTDVANGVQTIRISIPGMTAHRTVSMPFTSSRGRGKRGRGGNRGKDRRESSVTAHEPPTESTTSPGPSPAERGGRGRGRGRVYRGRGSDWGRRESAQGQSALQT